jgi:serine O-acetyltransferase
MNQTRGRFYFNAFTLHNIYRHNWVKKTVILPKLLEFINYLIFNCSVPSTAIIGVGSFCSHRGMSVVIHKKAVIGENCTIGTCVTLGGRGKGIEGAPIIGDNVYISSGAKILGPIRIGNNVIIGANSVVIKDVSDDKTVVGIPAREV